MEKEKIEDTQNHMCTESCFTKDQEGEYISEEHWAWLTDGQPSADPHRYPNKNQKDCAPGKLQEDGSRKVVNLLEVKK